MNNKKCKNCNTDMELVKGIVYRTTDAYHEDIYGLYMECPNCHYQEDYTREEEDSEE